MYETIIFDLDGTLLDTLDDLTDAVNAALLKCRLPIREKEEVRGFVGNGIKKLIERAVGQEKQAFVGQALQAFKDHYAVHCQDKTAPYAHIIETLKIMQEKGAKLAIVSNKADFAVQILTKEYFGRLIDVAVGENEEMGVRKKPAPDSLFAVMERLQADKAKTVYVGDSEVDIQTAVAAGVDCISVSWGFKDENFLLENGASTLARTPTELLKLCGY